MNRTLTIASCVTLLLSASSAAALTPMENLGKSIFFDESLSRNGDQSCAACHGPEVGFTGPIPDINTHGAVYEGSVPGRFGNRKPPSAAYATPSPILHFVIEKPKNINKREALFIGGNFWDGRATGEKLGNPAADQAQGPFLAPPEQAFPDNACVIYRVCMGSYSSLFTGVWGVEACAITTWPSDVMTQCASESGFVSLSDPDRNAVDMSYDQVALSIAAYEASSEVNAYTSKYDAYLAGNAKLTKSEKRGLRLFKSKGKCANCHILDPGPNGEPPLLTDFTFDNLGVPKNPENPFYDQPNNALGDNWLDLGLGGFLASRLDYQQYVNANTGKQKVPTLRNVDKRPSADFVKAYMHNGYFKSLKSVVHFYSTRDRLARCEDLGINDATEADALAAKCWPAPEIPNNVNDKELGKLNLTDKQENDIVVFLKTLTDGYVP